jgi:hypothetical protein
MACRPHTWDRGGTDVEERHPATVPVRDPASRITDVDRERAAAVLSEAFRDGMLRVEEFDQRLSAVYAATTVRDLDEAMADLHPEWLRELDEAEAAQRRSAKHRNRWHAEVRAYLKVMVILVGVWLLTSVRTGGEQGIFADGWNFWPIWPILGWGIPLYFSRPRRAAPPVVRDRPMAGVR